MPASFISACDLLVVVARDLLRLEIVEGFAEIVALAQDRDPRQAGLETVEDQLFVERAVVIFRHAPFGVVIGDVERIFAGPGAAGLSVGMQAGSAAHAMGCLAGMRTTSGSASLDGEAAGGERLAGIERVRNAVDAHQRDALALRRRAHRADRLVAGHDADASLRRELLEQHLDAAGARGAAMLHARDDLLADIAALVEIDAGEAVHVGLVRKRIAVHEIEPAARHAERDAMGLVVGGIDQLGADQVGQLLLEIFGDQDASAERSLRGSAKARSGCAASWPSQAASTPRSRFSTVTLARSL